MEALFDEWSISESFDDHAGWRHEDETFSFGDARAGISIDGRCQGGIHQHGDNDHRHHHHETLSSCSVPRSHHQRGGAGKTGGNDEGDLERFFKQGSAGLDTFLTNVPIKEEMAEVDVFDLQWGDDEEELKFEGSEDTTSPLLLLGSDENNTNNLLLNSGLLSFDDLTIHSTATTPSLLPASPLSPEPVLSAAPLSSPSLSPQLTEPKDSSNPSSPTPSSSPMPSSPSLLPVAPGVVFLQPQLLMQQQQQMQHSLAYTPCGVIPHLIAAPVTTATTVHTPPTTPSLVVQSAPTTPSSSPLVSRARRDSKSSGTKKPPSGVGSTPPRPRRRRAASTTVAREKQDRLEKDVANDDKAKAILSGPLTLEKLASLSTLKVSVLQKQLRMVNASTKGSKAQLIQRLVRYMYLFSQQHRHQPHHDSLCLATCGISQPAKSTASTRCNGPFVDPTLINAESNHTPARVKTERGIKRSLTHRDGPAPEGPSVLSSSAPASSFASFLSTHVFPSPLQITLTGRIVEEEEEEEFSD